MRKPFVIAIAIFFSLTGCTKIESTETGSSLIPLIDRVNTFDTLLRVITNNFPSDSSRVYKTDDHVIGTIAGDALFGKTSASVFLE